MEQRLQRSVPQAERTIREKQCLARKVSPSTSGDPGSLAQPPQAQPRNVEPPAQRLGVPGGRLGATLAPAAPARSSRAWAQLEALLSRGDTDTIERHKENDEGAEGWDLGGRLNELNLSSFADQSCRQEPDNCL